MKKRLPLITLRPLAWILFLLITASGYAQESLIQGLVIDENGEPLIGVSIQDQKTQKGTISDIDGKFSLEARIGNMLKISYIGYRTVTLAAAKDMRVVMSEDNMKLDEVVVVGYGVQKKVNLTGAVASVKSDEILKAQSANTSNALIGQIPGLIAKQTTGEPGLDGSQIYIRGVATFQGGTSPTYIIDGIERQAEDFARIDPNEIESLNVLKDAASAAIFGMRGANGVILVTTKRGNTGKVHVKYSGNVSIQKPTSLPEFANSTDYARMKNIYMGNTIYTDEEIRKFADGSDPERYPNTDWYKEMLSKNAVQHQHNITVDGGRDNIKFFTSFGYVHQDGLWDNLNYERYSLRSNIDVKITSTTQLSVDASGRVEYRHGSPQSSTNVFQQLIRNTPVLLAKYDNGLYTVPDATHPNIMAQTSKQRCCHNRHQSCNCNGQTAHRAFNITHFHCFCRTYRMCRRTDCDSLCHRLLNTEHLTDKFRHHITKYTGNNNDGNRNRYNTAEFFRYTHADCRGNGVNRI